MNARLGIAVAASEVRALLIQSNAIVWHASAPVTDAESVASAVSALIAQAPPLSWRTQVTAAVGPSWVQVKALHGLPPLKAQRFASELVRENQQAFFLSRRTPVVVADVHMRKDGAAWGAAFDEEIVIELTRAVRSKRLAVTRIVPSLTVIASAFPALTLRWTDGETLLELASDHDGLARVERLPHSAATAPPPLPEPLAALGADAPRFLDAYAAAVAPRTLPLTWHAEPDARRTLAFTRARNATFAVALFGAATFAAFGPGVRARRFARTASAELARSHAAQLDIARNEAELGRVTRVLSRVESFRAERGRVTRLLGALSQALPESTAVLTFRVDSAEGGFTAIAPHIADVLPELGSVSQMVAPRIIGSITKETVGGVRVERAAFRFRRLRPVANPVRKVAK